MPLTGAWQQWRVEAGLIADSFDCESGEAGVRVSGPCQPHDAPHRPPAGDIKQLIHLNNHQITASHYLTLDSALID